MKTMKYIAIVAALTLATGMTSCKSDEENNAKPSNETLIVEGGNTQIVMKSGDEMMPTVHGQWNLLLPVNLAMMISLFSPCVAMVTERWSS